MLLQVVQIITDHQAKTMSDSDSDSSWNEVIKDWMMVNKFGEAEASLWSFQLE